MTPNQRKREARQWWREHTRRVPGMGYRIVQERDERYSVQFCPWWWFFGWWTECTCTSEADSWDRLNSLKSMHERRRAQRQNPRRIIHHE